MTGAESYSWRRSSIPAPDPAVIAARLAPALTADFAERALGDSLRAMAERMPNAVALTGAGQTLTYRALCDRAERWAGILARAKTGPIAITLPHTPEATAAILGGLIAARTLLIIDPHWPAERIEAVITDAGAQTRLRGRVADTADALERAIADHLPNRADHPPSHPYDPDAPATVFFTSGSTGRPKGIVTSMFGNLTRARITLEAWRLGPTDRMLNTSSASTHSSFCRMLAAVCAGASLAHFTLATDGLTTLLRRLEAEEINILVATPGVLRALLSLPRFTHAARRLRLVLSAADALLATDIAQARAALPADCVIDHSYASTEAGIVSRWSVPDPPPEEARVPAGYPRDSLEFAFDPDETLIVRGRGVALGEWQAGTLVSGRMIADPTRPGWRVFNTGDRVRLGDDGLLRFVARADRQLNLNGVRIEPAEVETALRAEAGVTDATVIARAIEDRTVLVAFVASARPHEALIAGLRARVAQALPAAARPSRFIVLPEFPRLPSGKLDHPALLRLVDRL